MDKKVKAPGIINLQKLEKIALNNLSTNFIDLYPKFKSVFALASAGLPVSNSVIVSDKTASIKSELEKIIKRWNVNKYTIRSEKKFGTVNSKSVQGCKLEDVWINVEKFLDQGLLPMVIDQGDVYHNTYSVNILVDPKNYSEYYLEIVGSGFCSTDINKRDIVNERGILTKDVKLINSRVIDQKTYDHQVILLKENAIKKEIEKGRRFANKKEAFSWVSSYLKTVNALILKQTKYIPIDSKHLRLIWNFLPGILESGELMGYAGEKYVVSMAFVIENKTEKPYFWDIYPLNGYKKMI